MNKICPHCRSEIEESLAICPNCNEDIGKSWVVTYILTNPNFGGLFGAYNFYTKRTKIAIIQLILTLTMFGLIITLFWCLIDSFRILFNKFKDGYGNKLSKKVTIKSTALLTLLGVHRFYVERYVSGIFFILTLGGLGIWWLADLIAILTGNFKDKEGNLITE
ncbi:MAG: TM2 domain-containing protein [Candidatus Gastranaerophilaceae bacterium]